MKADIEEEKKQKIGRKPKMLFIKSKGQCRGSSEMLGIGRGTS